MSEEKVLIVEDNMDTRDLLEFHFSSNGFTVQTAEDGFAGLEKAKMFKPDIILLDLMLPRIDGLEVCRQLKSGAETKHIPVIMLTARSEEVDRIVGLELGADDYVTKPFSPRELQLRVRAVLRRSLAPAPTSEKTSETWHSEGLEVDFSAHRFTVDQEEVQLTATEFKLLAEFIRGRGKVLTRDHLLNTVWDIHYEGYSRTVDTHIRRLRQKLGPYADYVETIRGVGYRFRA
ncbi:MAG: response regulator transcription factor [Desulfovibrio sp.]